MWGVPRVAKPIGILGGTFNPIHLGHLRSGVELCDRLDLAELRFIPCAIPPHRPVPEVSATARSEMVRQAIQGAPQLRVDERELRRAGPSYTVDTLRELRQENASTPLCLIMGSDAFGNLTTWHEWDQLIDLAHLIVISRPGARPSLNSRLSQLVRDCEVNDARSMHHAASGLLLFQELTPLAISSSEIRRLVGAGKSIRYLVPDAVNDYILANGLYQEKPP